MVFIRAQEEVLSKDLYLYIFIFIYLYFLLPSIMCFGKFDDFFFHFLAIFSNLHLKNRHFSSTNGSLLGAQGFK